jgi:hypothetical protein
MKKFVFALNKSMSQFDILLEKELERYQSGGYLVGDRVRFRKNALNLDYIAKRASSFQDVVKACMEPSFDLNLRIGAIKSIYPTTTQNYGGSGTESPDGTFVDIYIEYAPGLYRNPMTVPIEAIELMDDGLERGPVPDSLKRKNTVHGPEEVKADSDINANVNLTKQNVQLPGANKWDDTKPGGGNFNPNR